VAVAGMSKAERLRATLAGQETDRSPVSFWHHFPGKDRTVEGFVSATVGFQRRHDLDFVKLMPTGMYSVVDYGATILPREDVMGTTQLETSPVNSPDDWARLPAARPDQGELKAQVEAVRQIRHALGLGAPIIQTIFSPLSMANKLAGDTFFEHLNGAEESLHPALERFSRDCVAFGRACLDAGADGIFFATQHASGNVDLPDGAFERLGAAYDLQVLEALAEDERAWCIVLHLHGPDPFFELAERYPVDAVNWHDRETSPSVREALSLTTRALVAGVDRQGPVVSGNVPEVVAQVHDAVRQADGRRLIVAPGCVLPVTAREENMSAVRRAVEQDALQGTG
jgi:uroporphyrinogen decarboxylase